jgi:hypothetical protein
MVTSRSDTCDKCKNASPVSYRVEPEAAWTTVVLNRWRRLCPGCFDVKAEKAGVGYSFKDLDGMSWSDRPGAEGRVKAKPLGGSTRTIESLCEFRGYPSNSGDILRIHSMRAMCHRQITLYVQWTRYSRCRRAGGCSRKPLISMSLVA